MKATVVRIANPLNLADREIELVEPGGRLSEVLPEGWARAILTSNGEAASGDDEVTPGACVVAIYQPEGIDPISLAINLLVAIAISAAFALLFPPPDPLQDRDDESSPTYGFGGISNNRSEGQPIPVVYGKLRVGGTIINEFVDVQGLPPKSTLRQLISFGEGTIAAIGSVTTDTPGSTPLANADIPIEIEINGNPAQNFRGVRAWARMGSNEQEVIPGFNETRQTSPIGSALASAAFDSDDTLSYVPGFSVSGDDEFTDVNDPVWDANSVVFDFNTEEIDGVVITLGFPRGYYRTDTTTGSTLAAFLRYQVRYIELDGANLPITTGGYAGDGYARLPIVGPIALQQRSQFQAQFRTSFTDPQTYTPATPGTALQTTLIGASDATYALGASNGYATGTEIPFLSGFAWVNITRNGTNVIASCISGNQGWELRTEELVFGTLGGGIPNPQTVLVFELGRGSRRIKTWAGRGLGLLPTTPPVGLAAGNFTDQFGIWTHVGWRYARNERIELCINGQVIEAANGEPPSNMDLEWIRTSIDIGDATAIRVDEVKVYNAAVTVAQFASDYSGGEGTTSPILGLENDLVFRSDFEDAAGTEQSGSGWWALTPTLTNATSGAALGTVRSGAASVLKRSKYRVEILRVSQSSTRSSVANEIDVDDMQSIISESLTYPNSGLLGVEIDASEQLNSGLPTTTSIVSGRQCPIWDGASVEVPAIRMEWSANPAWISLELITNVRYGLGRFYDTRSVDLQEWLEWALYCDEIVFDGRARITVSNPAPSGIDGDMYFENTTVDPDTLEVRGSLWFEIGLEEVNSLPPTWEPGFHLRFTGWPTTAEPGVDNDIDSVPGQGYEIYAVELLANVWTVKCYWDRMGELDPWLSGTRIGADVLSPKDLNGAIAEGGSRRFEFNGIFDVTRPAWPQLLSIMAVGRATPVPVGSRLNLRYSRPRTPIGVVTPSNIIANSFICDFSSPRTRPNSLTLNILDAEQNYEPVPVQVQTDDLEDVTNQTFIRQENKQLFGVTDFGQAERHGNYVLAVNQLQRRSGSFRAALDALPYQVGDLLRVSSEVLPRGDGGRVASTTNSSQLAALSDREDFSGAAWSATNVLVTDDTGTDPYGDATADTVAGTGFVEQALAFTDRTDGWVSIGIFFRDVTDAEPAIQLITDRGASAVTYDLGTLTPTFAGSDDLPVRGAIQDAGGSWRYCTASFFVKANDNFKATTTMTLRLYPRISTLDGSCEFSKVVATRAEYAAADQDGRGFVIDRDVTIDGLEVNTVVVQDARGNIGTQTVDTTFTPPGTYIPGDTIFLTAPITGMSFTRGNPYIVAVPSNELAIELSGVSRSSDLSAEFDWVEYDEEVFSDDAIEDPDRTPKLDNIDDRNRLDSRGELPSELVATDTLTEPNLGDFVTEVRVAWVHSLNTRDQITGTHVWWRELPETAAVGAWQFTASVDGLTTNAAFRIPGLAVGSIVEVSVVPRTRQYPTVQPDEGRRSTLLVRGLAWAPVGPTSLTVEARDLEVYHVVTYPGTETGVDRTRVLTPEIRRGGWVLGQPVVIASEGARELISTNIFAAPFEENIGRLHCRARARSGAYSSEAFTDAGITLNVVDDEPSLAMGGEQRWEKSSDGATDWYPAVPDSEGPNVQGSLIENVPGNYLEFTGAGLTGSYFTRYDATSTISEDQNQQPRPLLVMASAEAEQVHPITVGEFTSEIGSLEAQRWSIEGPMHTTDQDPENCTLALQIQINVDGTDAGWTGWQAFVCGVYTAVDVRLQMLATRPSDDYNIRIHRYHHKIAVPRRSLIEQGSRDLHARTEII